VEFKILGPLEVLDGRRPIALGTLKERSILAVLLLHANEFVSRERLIDELWGESPPPTARKAVNVYLSQLRKTLGADGDSPIATAVGGYRLAVDPDRLDAARMQRLLASARENAATGDPETASRLYEEALAHWRGPTLAGIQLESHGRDEIARVDELRLTAQLNRIDCHLALGRHEAVLGELSVLVSEHPLRERIRAQQMLALYRADRQADALDAYQQARTLLVYELGIEPSPALQRLQLAILRQDPALEAPGGLPSPPEAAAAQGDLFRGGRAETTRKTETALVRDPTPARRVAWSRRSSVRWAAAALSSAAALTAIAGLAASNGGGDGTSVRVTGHSLAQVDPHGGAVVADTPLSGTPVQVAATADAVWVADDEAGTLTRIDPTTRTVVRTIPVGNGLTDVLATRRAVWVLAARDSRLIRIDPASDQIVARLPIAVRVSPLGAASIDSAGLAVAGRYVYVNGITTAWKVDSHTGEVVNHFSEDGFALCTVAADALWTVDTRSLPGAAAVLERRDLNTNAVTGTLPLPAAPAGLVATRSGVWVVETDGQLLRLDPIQLALEGSTNVGGRPESVAVIGNSLWIADSAGGRLVRINGDTGQVTDRIRLPAEPGGLATDGHSLWVTLPYSATSANAPRSASKSRGVQEFDRRAATGSYSWMRSPSRSRRAT
jgi:DNA-binding SARP family transcriptional activator/DNA-binding beta-propeller fold protein YncE